MTTKAQEMKALETIKNIVAELGEDSYIATAFTGVFDDAEENIKNDFALSMNGRWQDAEQKVEELKAKLAEQDKALIEVTKKFEQAQKNIEVCREDNKRQWHEFMEQSRRAVDAEVKLQEKEREVITLKARLFDLIDKKGEQA